MSDYGNPPQDPNTPPNPYGAPVPGQPAYGQPAYGQPAYGAPAYAAGPVLDYAGWPKRVGAYLIDAIVTSIAAFPIWIAYGILAATAEKTTLPDGTVQVTSNGGAAVVLLMLFGALTGLAFFIWNTCLKGGRTGYSIGKGVLGIKLIGEQTGAPIGAGMAFLRYLCHIVDGIPCNLGYLWPLWDAKRQTFADKILGTVVINQPKG